VSSGDAPSHPVPAGLDALLSAGPGYVRQLKKQSLVPNPTLDSPEHLNLITELLFLNDAESAGEYSLYRIVSPDGLRRAATGLLSGRQSTERFTQPIHFVWITEAELQQIGASINQTLGTTACTAANALHFDWCADPIRARALSELLIRAGFQSRTIDLRKLILKEWLKLTQAERCRATQAGTDCLALPCLPPPVSAAE
jgi:hypothetical protein